MQKWIRDYSLNYWEQLFVFQIKQTQIDFA